MSFNSSSNVPSITVRVGQYLAQEQKKIEEMEEMVGPLFSRASFEEYRRLAANACDAQVQAMLLEDVTGTYAGHEDFLSSSSNVEPVATWTSSHPLTASSQIRPIPQVNTSKRIACPFMKCECILYSTPAYFSHKLLHESLGHVMDPSRRDTDILLSSEVQPATVVPSSASSSSSVVPSSVAVPPQYHFDPYAHSGPINFKKVKSPPTASQHVVPPSSTSASSKANINAYGNKKLRKSLDTTNIDDASSMSDVSDTQSTRLAARSNNDAQPQQQSQPSPQQQQQQHSEGFRGYVGGHSKPAKKKAEKRSQYSVIFKMRAIQKYDEYVAEGRTAELQASVAKYFDINQSSICRWVRQRDEIAAAFVTAEQDRMRVTSTFKKKSAEVTGGEEEYYYDIAQLARSTQPNHSSLSAYNNTAYAYPTVGASSSSSSSVQYAPYGNMGTTYNPYVEYGGGPSLHDAQVQQILQLNASQYEESTVQYESEKQQQQGASDGKNNNNQKSSKHK